MWRRKENGLLPLLRDKAPSPTPSIINAVVIRVSRVILRKLFLVFISTHTLIYLPRQIRETWAWAWPTARNLTQTWNLPFPTSQSWKLKHLCSLFSYIFFSICFCLLSCTARRSSHWFWIWSKCGSVFDVGSHWVVTIVSCLSMDVAYHEVGVAYFRFLYCPFWPNAALEHQYCFPIRGISLKPGLVMLWEWDFVCGLQEYVKNSRGVQLFTCRWLPFSSPKALVFLCHGLFLSLSNTHTHRARYKLCVCTCVCVWIG